MCLSVLFKLFNYYLCGMLAVKLLIQRPTIPHVRYSAKPPSALALVGN